MVLQQQPAKACVYGALGTNGTAASIHVAVTGGGATPASYNVEAQVTADGGEWKACLQPTVAGGDFTITATCTGCANATAAVLDHVTFGDVWYVLTQAQQQTTVPIVVVVQVVVRWYTNKQW
jgi:hypothetical protein